MTLEFEVTRKVVIMEETDDECSLSLPGWYWRYDGANQISGPYPTLDAAISAATRGP